MFGLSGIHVCIFVCSVEESEQWHDYVRNDVQILVGSLRQVTPLMAAIKERNWALAATEVRQCGEEVCLAVTPSQHVPGTQPGLTALMAIAYRQAPAENSADWSLYEEVALTLLALFRRHGLVDLKMTTA